MRGSAYSPKNRKTTDPLVCIASQVRGYTDPHNQLLGHLERSVIVKRSKHRFTELGCFCLIISLPMMMASVSVAIVQSPWHHWGFLGIAVSAVPLGYAIHTRKW